MLMFFLLSCFFNFFCLKSFFLFNVLLSIFPSTDLKLESDNIGSELKVGIVKILSGVISIFFANFIYCFFSIFYKIIKVIPITFFFLIKSIDDIVDFFHKVKAFSKLL